MSMLALGFSLGSAALLLGSMTILALPLIDSPKVLFYAALYRLLNLVSDLATARDFFTEMFQTTSISISPIGWMVLAGLLCELGVLWVVSLRILTKPRRVEK
jgi:hypothetical protein